MKDICCMCGREKVYAEDSVTKDKYCLECWSKT